jgi:phospholipase C
VIVHHTPPPTAAHVTRARGHLPGLITHIVVVIQENRSIDNLFNGFCATPTQCANTLPYDPYDGHQILAPVDLTSNGPSHSHEKFVSEFDGGAMDGFAGLPDSYVPSGETPGYRQMFTVDGVLNDYILAPNMGPSFPAHLYGIAGHAGGYDLVNPVLAHEDIADNPGGDPTYCGSNGVVESVSLATAYPGVPVMTSVCRDHPTIFDRLPASYTWKYYAHWKNDGTSLWAPTKAIAHLVNSPNFVNNPGQIVTDINSGVLPNLAFVSPLPENSDHPGDMTDNLAGQRWVASIVNAIGGSSYWTNTVIILYWDDWGGWFDHVVPTFAYDPFLPASQLNPNEYGFRLSYGVISAYARTGTVAHGLNGQPCSASDSLAFIEQTWNLTPLGTEDVLNTGCTAGMLNFASAPHQFQEIILPGGNAKHRTAPRRATGD